MTSPSHTLNNGISMPMLGLGTWQLRGKKGYHAILSAIDIGYRHIDTATIYQNEKDVGKAVRDCGLSREELFVTTKVWNNDHGYRKTSKA